MKLQIVLVFILENIVSNQKDSEWSQSQTMGNKRRLAAEVKVNSTTFRQQQQQNYKLIPTKRWNADFMSLLSFVEFIVENNVIFTKTTTTTTKMDTLNITAFYYMVVLSLWFIWFFKNSFIPSVHNCNWIKCNEGYLIEIKIQQHQEISRKRQFCWETNHRVPTFYA